VKNTLCLIVKNEQPYLLEWIAHHKAMGIHSFVIYDNLSTDGTTDMLKALERAGIIKYHLQAESRQGSPQRLSYNHCLTHHGDKTDLITFIDTDEFLTSPSGDDIPKHIEQVFLQNPDMAAMAVNWRIFGSSGHAKQKAGFVTERFLMAGKTTSNVVKTIVKPEAAGEMFTHYVDLKSGRYGDEIGRPVTFNKPNGTPAPGTVRSPSAKTLQLNHYMVKSREEFEMKINRGNANFPSNHPNKFNRFNTEYFDKYDLNEAHDAGALSMIDKTRDVYEELSALCS